MDKLEIQSKRIADDPTAEDRKKDHIELAFKAQVDQENLDKRFYYEPLLSAHPVKGVPGKGFTFLGKEMKAPVWVSSMTGGTKMARKINHNLAKICGHFGMGMGLGSCRSLLYDNDFLKDFDVRHLIGDDLPFYANLGIAQIEQIIEKKEFYLVHHLIDKLSADGLIIHVNPFQEWMQPEGDHLSYPPLETIKRFLEKVAEVPVIVKEVGQGLGYESMKALFQLPLEAIDFAASGGTNFSLLELLRGDEFKMKNYQGLAHIGHSAEDMVLMSNRIIEELGDKALCQQIIISGGVKDFLDGHYLMEKAALPSIYGQASGFLKYATRSYEDLFKYVEAQIEGLKLAKAFLRVRESNKA